MKFQASEQSITNSRKNRGFSVIEVLLAMCIFTIFSTAVLSLAINSIENDSKSNLNTQAQLYAQEGLEAMRSIRDAGYLTLSNGDHGLQNTAGSWSFIPAPEDMDGFYERTVTIEDVYRDENGDIDEEAGIYLDPDTKKVISEVVWQDKGILPKTVKVETYITNWRGEDWIQTTCPELETGTFDNTMTEAIEGGFLEECGISIASIEQASTFFTSEDVGSAANDVHVTGDYAYIAAHDSGRGMMVIDVSDRENPHEISRTFLFGNGEYIYEEGGYVYIALKTGFIGVYIIDVSDPHDPDILSGISFFKKGNEPIVVGDRLYMGTDIFLYGLVIYDISNKSLPTLIDWETLGGKVYAVEADGDYAYLGVDDDHSGFKSMDISDPNNAVILDTLDVGEEVNTIIANGPLLYAGTEESGNSLVVINVSDPADPYIETSLDVGGEIQDLTISGDYLYAAINDSNAGVAAINISNPFVPSLAYNLDIEGQGRGISSDANYVYIATSSSKKGLVIIGTTETGVLFNGTYTSSELDTGSEDTRYNFIEWDHVEVPGGNIKFQIKTANSSGNLATATWVGPDGTASTFYENARVSIVTDPGASGFRYFQYKAYLESDGVSEPLLKSVRINYTQ